MKITKLVVRNFMGISEREIAVPPGGFIARGDNGLGKTSILQAIRSALAAQQISPAAIRNGADRAEILIDIDDVTVKRVTTPKGSTLSVERAGMKASKPQAFITKLVGSCAIDPLDIMLLSPKERRAMICAATPMTVTPTQLAKYLSADLPLDFDFSGHGLEVVERARKFFYDERALANKEVAEAKATAERLAADAQKTAAAVTPGPIVPNDEARAALAGAERELLALEGRVDEAVNAAARTEGQRAEIAHLRSAADRLVAEAPEAKDCADLEKAFATVQAEIAVLKADLANAEALATKLAGDLGVLEGDNQRRESHLRMASERRAQAASLEAALAAATVSAPKAAELASAKQRVEGARATLERAALQAAALAAVAAADAAKGTHAALLTEAADLDQTVKRLANEAPAELLAAAEGIPGLSLDGDEILLDGVRLGDLCGAEQMRFAVDVARRANAHSKIIVCDGLERLAPAKQESFVSMATAGGFQLLATAVQDGEIQIQAIASDDAAQAAE